jgi:serine/threonine protein kinase
VGTTPEGDPYVVMELLRGKTLGASLAEHGRVDPAQAVRVLLPIAHGLVAAHACGVIHRDLKPNNVFLARTRDGRTQPKIIDFGLARPLLGQGPRITQTGNAMGSPTYMAPEQIRGANVTEQADIWGFSVMLYELIHGQPPFADETLEGLFQQILGAAPQSLHELGRVDDQLWTIIAKGLRKAPAQRWANMRMLGAALAAWLIERGYRDDVCGASLEAVWLRAPRQGAKAEVLAADPVTDLPAPKRRRRPSFSDISTGRWTPVRLQRRPWLLVALSAIALTAVALHRTRRPCSRPRASPAPSKRRHRRASGIPRNRHPRSTSGSQSAARGAFRP